MRVGWLVSGQGKMLEYVDTCMSSDVAIVVADRECEAFCNTDNPRILVPRVAFGSREKFSDEILNHLEKNDVDFVCCTFDSLLSGRILDRYRGRLINFHPGRLPEFAGIKAIERTIGSGVEFGGCTVHHIDDGVDTGNIIAEARIKIPKSCSVERYGEMVYHIGRELMLQIVKGYEDGTYSE